MFKLALCEWIYVLSVSLQLSGAVLLLIKYCFLSVEKRIKENESKETHTEDEELVLGQTQPPAPEFRENVRLNRAAFALLSIGYLLGVWGSISNGHRLFAFVWIVIVSSVVTVTCFFRKNTQHT